jgi:hypothetical protein
MVRERGLFLVEPREGMTHKELIEAALGLKGGYSAGLVELEIPDGAGEVWLAWVETQAPNGSPLFEYRALPGAMAEAEVEAALAAAGEEILKLNRSLIHRI